MLLRRVVRRCGTRPAAAAADALLSRALSTLSLSVDADRPTWPSSAPASSLGRTVAALKSAEPPSASAAVRKRRHPKKSAPTHPHRLRTADARVSSLLSGRSPPDAFVRTCEALAAADEVALLAGTDPRVWSVALRRRLARGDDAGARALLDLAAGFASENTTESLWTDLLFAVLRAPPAGAALRAEGALERLLDALAALHGRRFVAHVVVAAANGCGKLGMFDEARRLVRFHLDRLQGGDGEGGGDVESDPSPDPDADPDADTAPPLPASVLGTLASRMADGGRFADVVAFVERELLAHARFDAARDLQQQGFLALFRGYAGAGAAPEAGVDAFLRWTQRLADARDADALRTLRLERGFGAAIQTCVAADRPSLALRCFHALRALNDRFSGRVDVFADDAFGDDAFGDDAFGDDAFGDDAFADDAFGDDALADERATRYAQLAEVAPPDENVFVNALKASAAVGDDGLFRDVYREMAARGAARSAGFGSAIRFCSVRRDVALLEEVLGDAFAREAALAGPDAWRLPIEQYNDALGCLAAAGGPGALEAARALFETRLLGNPRVAPDHVTMLQLAECYRGAPRGELFELMEVFLDAFGLAPNAHVYTSLLAACARQRLAGDAAALLAAMDAHGVEPDLKTYTTAAFVLGAQGDHAAVVALVRAMHDRRLAPDQKFFDYALRALDEAGGVDICFALPGELCAEGLPVPAGLYRALVDLGTARGLVERTLHVAYNMECDGFALSSAQLRALAARSASEAEVEQLARTFLLLHGEFLRGSVVVGGPSPSGGPGDGDGDGGGLRRRSGREEQEEREAGGGARFDADVYDAMVELLTRFNKRDALVKVRALAERAGVRLREDADADEDADEDEDEIKGEVLDWERGRASEKRQR